MDNSIRRTLKLGPCSSSVIFSWLSRRRAPFIRRPTGMDWFFQRRVHSIPFLWNSWLSRLVWFTFSCKLYKPYCKRVTAEIGSVKRLYRACVMLLYSAKVWSILVQCYLISNYITLFLTCRSRRLSQEDLPSNFPFVSKWYPHHLEGL